MRKIYKLEELKIILSNEKKRKKKIVLCHGVYDLLHIGHIKHLEKSKSYGDKLVVTITADKYVAKGPNRPFFNENLRCEAIAALKVVDYVAINYSYNAVIPIKYFKPDFYCKGKDYKNLKDDITKQINNEVNLLKKQKGKFIITDELSYSSSHLLNNSQKIFKSRHYNIIKKIKKNINFEKIKTIVDKIKKQKILIIGETIIDQYNFCETIGKSGKEPVLVLKDVKTEEYLGGAAFIAKNISSFSNNISLLTMLGEKKHYINRIKKELKNVNCHFIFKKNSPTIIKKRFVDNVSNHKILGVYSLNDEILQKKQELLFEKKIITMAKKNDLVIVSDYGHGFISKKIAKIICKKTKYLALNTQINASNIGFHTLRNYNNFFMLIINEREIRHELRDNLSEIEHLIKKLAKERQIKYLIVTRGSEGSIFYNQKQKKFYKVDAYATKVIDKIGAGDTMLSILGPCLRANLNIHASLILSSLCAAQSVETIGNKNIIDKSKILKILNHLLK